jgi:hypothetical protein
MSSNTHSDEIRIAEAARDGEWSFAAQKGTPGRCMYAQVWAADGTSLAIIQSTEDPAVATARAAFIAHFNPERVLAMLAERENATKWHGLVETILTVLDLPTLDFDEIAGAIRAKFGAAEARATRAEEGRDEASRVVADLINVWPEDSLPPGPLCVRAAAVINTPALQPQPQEPK